MVDAGSQEGKILAQNFLDSWIPHTWARQAFGLLLRHAKDLPGCALAFSSRPGVSHSLRVLGGPGQDDIVALVDVIDDDPSHRWLSVCFYEHRITDPEGRGDAIPGGLLGQTGYCFDVDEEEPALVEYLLGRMDEAHRSLNEK